MVRILLVEDERALARAMATGLADEGHAVEVAHSRGEANACLAAGGHDGMVLDLRLPDGSGLDLLRALRSGCNRLPVLVVTACDATQDVVAGLDAGADDYLTKPFAFAELTARLRAVLRRATATAGPDGSLTWQDLRLDPTSQMAWRGGEDLHLSRLEFLLLEQLMRRPGCPVARDQLTARLWGADDQPESNALEVHAAGLRRKLETHGPRLVQTRRGIGYVLSASHP